jgi:hypothetical protein
MSPTVTLCMTTGSRAVSAGPSVSDHETFKAAMGSDTVQAAISAASSTPDSPEPMYISHAHTPLRGGVSPEHPPRLSSQSSPQTPDPEVPTSDSAAPEESVLGDFSTAESPGDAPADSTAAGIADRELLAGVPGKSSEMSWVSTSTGQAADTQPGVSSPVTRSIAAAVAAAEMQTAAMASAPSGESDGFGDFEDADDAAAVTSPESKHSRVAQQPTEAPSEVTAPPEQGPQPQQPAKATVEAPAEAEAPATGTSAEVTDAAPAETESPARDSSAPEQVQQPQQPAEVIGEAPAEAEPPATDSLAPEQGPPQSQQQPAEIIAEAPAEAETPAADTAAPEQGPAQPQQPAEVTGEASAEAEPPTEASAAAEVPVAAPADGSDDEFGDFDQAEAQPSPPDDEFGDFDQADAQPSSPPAEPKSVEPAKASAQPPPSAPAFKLAPPAPAQPKLPAAPAPAPLPPPAQLPKSEALAAAQAAAADNGGDSGSILDLGYTEYQTLVAALLAEGNPAVQHEWTMEDAAEGRLLTLADMQGEQQPTARAPAERVTPMPWRSSQVKSTYLLSPATHEPPNPCPSRPSWVPCALCCKPQRQGTNAVAAHAYMRSSQPQAEGQLLQQLGLQQAAAHAAARQRATTASRTLRRRSATIAQREHPPLCSACAPFKCCHALHALHTCGSTGHSAAFSQCSVSIGHQTPSTALHRAGNGAGGGSPAAPGLRCVQRPRVGGRVALRQRQRLWQLHGRPAPTQQRLWRRWRPFRGVRRNGLRVRGPSHGCASTLL